MTARRTTAGTPLTVHKLDAEGREVWRYPGRALEQAPDRIVLQAVFARRPMEVGGLRMEPGDRFVETFYTDRWYNVFAVYRGSGSRLRGWYCNIARPARLEAEDVFAEDLALDLVVFPDRTWRVLDREAFEALPLPAPDRDSALRGLADLMARAESGEEPFLPSGWTRRSEEMS
ncbi:MAG: DUF402 domain-containing protein [Anaerolineales bacterium]